MCVPVFSVLTYNARPPYHEHTRVAEINAVVWLVCSLAASLLTTHLHFRKTAACANKPCMSY